MRDSKSRVLRGTALAACAAACLFHPATAQEEPPAAPTQVAIEAGDPPAGADLSAASALVRAGDYPAADEALAALEPQHPEDPDLLMMRGEVLLALGRAEEAKQALVHCAEIDPTRARVQFQLATAMASTGDTDGALAAYGRELEQGREIEVLVLARLNRSLLFQQKRQWADAAAELESVLDLQPERNQVFGDLATLYLQAGQFDEAEAALARGLEAGFRSGEHYYSLGARTYQRKDYEKAAKLFEKALELDPALGRAERSIAAALDQLGRKDEAIAHLKRYLELEPNAPDAAAIARRVRGSGS